MKCVLLSIQPRWCDLIVYGDKKIEVRKTKPKLQTPFKCYIYCTLSQSTREDVFIRIHNVPSHTKNYQLYGKIIGEFICDRFIPIRTDSKARLKNIHFSEILQTRLSTEAIRQYIGADRTGYGWHISELVIYNTPKELRDFGLKRPPQSWCYVEEYKNEVYGLDGTVYTPNEDRTCWVGKQKEREHNDP